jgi:ATP-dependent DNA helicase RecG
VNWDPQELFESDDLAWLEKPDRDVETPWVERKSKFDKDEIARQISGFANGDPPGGLIVVGVDKEGRIRGLGDQRTKVFDEIGRIPLQSWSGTTHRFVRTPSDNIELLFILVPSSESRVVCTTAGQAFIRRGSSTVELKQEEIQEKRYQRGERNFEEEPIAKFDPDLLDSKVLADLLAGIHDRNGTTLPRSPDEVLADKHMTLRKDGETHLTVAGAIALAQRPTDFIPQARIHFIRLDGKEERFGAERNVTKEHWFEGPTVRMLDEVRLFIRTLVKDFDYLASTGMFVTEPEYPELAWDEALVNAILHRSYSIGNSPIQVRMFDDRLEIESPGGFPGVNRPNAEGDFPGSNPRNIRLGDALRYLGLVRLAKEGTRRMKQEMEKMGLPSPSYEERHGVSVLVTLRNDIHRRGSAISARESWHEVADLLRQDLAVYRRKGYEKWNRLRVQRAKAPRDVLDVADGLLRSAELSSDEKRQILQILVQERSSQIGELAKKWAGDLLIAGWVDEQSYSAVANILASSEEALELVLSALESGRRLHERPKQRKLAFEALATRFRQETLPPTDWASRVVKVCFRYRSEGGSLYWEITGQRLE